MSNMSSPTSDRTPKSINRISEDQRRRLREKDFWTSLILFGFSTAMLIGGLQMPMSESYGGVRNAWYVSPALLPLIVAGGLILLSAALLANAIRSGGARRTLTKVRLRPNAPTAAQRRAFLAALLIAAYVYALLPRVDFVVATALFLLAFIGGFYPDNGRIARPLVIGFLVFALATGVAGILGFRPVRGEAAGLVVDGAGLLLFVILAIAASRQVREGSDQGRVRTTVIVAIAVPLILGPIFKFALLVPLPTEGAIIQTMEQGVYLLRPAEK